jgi:hypothetical protein
VPDKKKTEGTDKITPPPAIDTKLKTPEKAAGPQQSTVPSSPANSGSITPQPLARTADLLANREQGLDKTQRARRTESMQQSVGNARVGRMLGAGVQRKAEANSILASPPPHAGKRDEPPSKPDEIAKANAKKAGLLVVASGVVKVKQDALIYGQGKFPRDYHETLVKYLFEIALKAGKGNYDFAFGVLKDVADGDYSDLLQKEYVKQVGEGGINGWDKVKHFTRVANYQRVSKGVLVPELASYGKEIWDEMKHLTINPVTGKPLHPTGWDDEDILADEAGEAFAEEMTELEEIENKKKQKPEEKKKEQKNTGPKKTQKPKQKTKPRRLRPEDL